MDCVASLLAAPADALRCYAAALSIDPSDVLVPKRENVNEFNAKLLYIVFADLVQAGCCRIIY